MNWISDIWEAITGRHHQERSRLNIRIDDLESQLDWKEQEIAWMHDQIKEMRRDLVEAGKQIGKRENILVG